MIFPILFATLTFFTDAQAMTFSQFQRNWEISREKLDLDWAGALRLVWPIADVSPGIGHFRQTQFFEPYSKDRLLS